MKKILTLAIALFSASLFSQIELIETSKTEVVSQISYVYLEKEGENEYHLFYKNMNSVAHEYVSFSFKNLNDDLEKLYKILANGFVEVPRDPLKMKANGEIVWLNYYYNNVDGLTTLTIEQTVSLEPEVKTKSRPLTAEDIDKLFGK